jgi:hypothetical protein
MTTALVEKCQCCNLPGQNTHAVAAEGYAGTGCRDCATLAIKLGGHATRLRKSAGSDRHPAGETCPACGAKGAEAPCAP